MKELKDYIVESKSEFNEQNMLAIMCAVESIVNEGNYDLSLKAHKVKPTIDENIVFEMANILLKQKICIVKPE